MDSYKGIRIDYIQDGNTWTATFKIGKAPFSVTGRNSKTAAYIAAAAKIDFYKEVCS